MRLLPLPARGAAGLGLVLAGLGLARAQWGLVSFGLAVALAALAGGGLWMGSRIRALRRWLQSREGSVAFHGTNAWANLESELRYYFRERDRQLREVRRRLSRLEGLAQELPVGVAVVDPEGRIMEANRKTFELLAMDPHRDQGRKVLGWLREPELADLFARDGPAIRHGTAPYHPDPSRTLEVTTTRKDDGTFLLMVEEITERLRLQKMREDFVANVSHELKSPLTSLRGFAETLLDAPDLAPERRTEFVGIMHAQVERMQTLVADLLTLSRLEAHPGPDEAEPIDPETLLKPLERRFSETASKKGIRLAVTGSEEGPQLQVLGDAEALDQALANLVDNAFKYTPEGGEVAVTLEERATTGEVAIHVRDSGIGIPPGDIPRLTERFYRVDKGRSRAVGGTGLGLSIVKHILHNHGGRLEVTSEQGRGSTFTAILPTMPEMGA